MGQTFSRKVTSLDGTPIAYHQIGAGPPLILVTGTGAANPLAWTEVTPALSEHFTVLCLDRRGRGESGDSPAYAIEREFEDLAAVLASLNEPASLLGHSFGALCALEASLITPNLRKLILYEPELAEWGSRLYPPGFIDRLESLLEAGDRAGVLETLYRENAGLSAEEIEQLIASPAWHARLATAHTLPREMRAEETYHFEPERFRGLNSPTLLMLGSESPPSFNNSVERITNALPNSKITVLEGQQHIAMYTAPGLFLREVLGFLTSGS